MENIVGHKRQIENLRKQIENKNLSHSYLFQGKSGIGKKKIAMAFSKALLCERKGEMACGSCSSCLKFDSLNHPDFKLVEPDNKMVKKSQIDEIVGSVKTKPFESDRKIFVIDQSHLMNKESMNGLLKTLEEPPEFMTIILITDRPGALLDTIKSRCQTFKFYPLSKDEMEDYLSSKAYEGSRARFLARLSEGSVGNLERILNDPDFLDDRDQLIKIIDLLLSGNRASAFTNLEFFEDRKDKLEELLSVILLWFRDLAIYKEMGNTDLIINTDKEDLLRKQSNLQFNRINDIIENVENTKFNIKSNVNFALAIEMMLLNIQGDNEC